MERTYPLSLILQTAPDVSIIGQIERLGIIGILALLILVLWRAFQEKDRQLIELLKQSIESDTKHLEVMRHVERLLESQRQ